MLRMTPSHGSAVGMISDPGRGLLDCFFSAKGGFEDGTERRLRYGVSESETNFR